MDIHACPHCRALSCRRLEEASREAFFVNNYYRCDGCSHVWGVPNGNPHAARSDVTLRLQPSPSRRALLMRSVGERLAILWRRPVHYSFGHVQQRHYD